MFLKPPLATVGTQIRPFRLLNMQGDCLGPLEHMGTNGLVLLIFATDWHAEDLGLLTSYQKACDALHQAGVAVMAISSLNWETLYQLNARLNLTYPVLFDQCCRQATMLGAAWLPKFVSGRAVFWLDADLRIRLAGKNTQPSEILKALNK